MVDLKLSDTPLWEKLIGLAGFVLIVWTVGYLLWAAATNNPAPPLIEFEINEVETLTNSDPTYYLVNVTVRNRGSQAVSHLNVQGQITLDDDAIEQSETSVDYLAPDSWQELGFYFQNNPENKDLVFQALNYQIP